MKHYYFACDAPDPGPVPQVRRVWMPSWHDLKFPTSVDTGSGRCVRFGERPKEPCPEGGEWVEIPYEKVPGWVWKGLA